MALGSELAPFFGAAGAASGAGGLDLGGALFYLGRAYRQPSLMGDLKKWTLSFWFKRAVGINNSTQTLFAVYGNDLYFFVRLETDDRIRINNWDSTYSDTALLISNHRIRDVGAWYHLVVAADTNQSTAADRLKVYLNGEQIQTWSTANYPAQYQSMYVGSRQVHMVGANNVSQFFNGYFADFKYIDGQQLTPSDFAAENDTTYAYEPIAFEGNYVTPGGTPNDGTTWSSYLTGNVAFSGSYPATQCFDTSFTTAVGQSCSFGNLYTITFTPPSPIPASTLRLRCYARDSAGTTTITVNGGTPKTLKAGSPQIKTFDVSELITGGQISSIVYSFNYNVANQGGEVNQLYGFIVDNVLLQDGVTTNTPVSQSFALNFTDSSSLGTDSSPNGNNLTPSGLDIAQTNYAVNLDPSLTAYPNTTLSGGNLSWSGSTANDTGTVSSIPIPTNKKTYVEVTHNTTGGGDPGPGVANKPDTEMGLDTIKAWWRGGSNGTVSVSTLGAFTGSATTWNNGDVLGIALDHTANGGAGSITFYKNGVPALTGGSGWTSYPELRFEWQNNGTGTDSGTWNFGATAFSYPVADHTGLFYTTSDAVVDTPLIAGTSTGAGADIKGNYCIWDELTVNGTSGTVRNGGLDTAGLRFSHGGGASGFYVRVGTMSVTSGKWYYEVRYAQSGTASTTLNDIVGWADVRDLRFDDAVGNTPRSYGYYDTGNARNNNNNTAFGDKWTAGDVIGCAIDIDNLKIYWSKNGVWQNSADPAAGTGSVYTIQDPVSNYFRYAPAACLYYAGSTCTANFGQTAFEYPAPDGFKSLCTANMTDPTVLRPEEYFDPITYNGDTTSSYSSLLFQPEFLWLKSRSNSDGHFLWDSLRGVTKYLSTETTGSEGTQSGVTSFDTNGFSWGSWGPIKNTSMAGWCWDATGVSETNYDPLSTGAPVNYVGNHTTGFSIVQVPSPNNTEPRAHGCGAPVEFIIAKANNSATEQWHLYHRALGRTRYGVFTDAAWPTSDQWGSSEPTDSYFYVKANTGSGANYSTGMIYYMWAGVEGYSRFGSYVGTGNATTGPFVNCGFRPAFVFVKVSDGIGNYSIQDDVRNGFNSSNYALYPDQSTSETLLNVRFIDLCSNGFKIRSSSSEVNDLNKVYIYAAFAEHPFKYTTAR